MQYIIWNTTEKISFPLHFPADLVTFTEEILNGKLHFLCSVNSLLWRHIDDSKNLDIAPICQILEIRIRTW